ncbi:MAG TPA: DUF2889 domain-containing protein [Blastocatellia bacterium]|jgi:hypothetical protein
MAVQFSIPLSSSSYLRTFESEIDISAENDLMVRGVMSDHRFAFEHRWKVRAPEYEVIEASAWQIAGDKSDFDPELCQRYAGIAGVRIGRGFSKRVVSDLGDLPGAQEHLFLAIEMARIAQQVYQYSPEFEAQFPAPSGSSSEIAHLAWLKDRAYMNLANSCYAYRDESEALFASREVRCGFDPGLTRPQPGEKHVFWRSKRISIERTNQVYACESAMEDRIHDIKIRFDLSREGVISNAQSRGLRVPYYGICEDAQLRTSGLNGLKVNDAFVAQFAGQVGGASGCTHLFDLSMDCLRLFHFVPR